MPYHALEKLHQLQNGYRRLFRVGGVELLLIQENDQVFLVENRCPHMEATLQHGRVASGYITCPMHGISFDLRTGRAHPGTPAPVPDLRIFAPVYEGNTVGIEV